MGLPSKWPFSFFLREILSNISIFIHEKCIDQKLSDYIFRAPKNFLVTLGGL